MICAAWGITHICFTPTLLRKGPVAQRRALDAVWKGILTLDAFPPGTHATLMELGSSALHDTRYALKVSGKIHASGSGI